MSITKRGKRSGKYPREPEAVPTCRENWEPDGPCITEHLPKELLTEILSWLPAKTILICKFVSKAWLLVISEPRFVSLHRSRTASRTGILIQIGTTTNRSGEFCLTKKNNAKKLHFTQVDKCSGSADNLLMEKMTFTTKNTAPVDFFDMVNCCNGLVCLYGTQVPSLIVCNPLLNEYITVPLTSGMESGTFVGLGWSAVTDEYKLLRTFYPHEGDWKNLQAEVYTIGSGVWRSIGNAPTTEVVLPFNSLLHGAIHFAPFDFTYGSRLIHSFNFETEQFRVLPPPSFRLLKLEYTGRITLGVWESCLTYCELNGHATKFDLWVMKEYGVEESWTKALVVDNVYPTEFVYASIASADFYEPVMFFDDGEILMVYNDRVIVSYNPETKTFRKTKIIQTRCNFFRSVAYSPCFESLLKFFKGEEVRKMRG